MAHLPLQEDERRKQAGAQILEEFHNPHHRAAASNSAAASEKPSAVSAAAPQNEQDTEAALRKCVRVALKLVKSCDTLQGTRLEIRGRQAKSSLRHTCSGEFKALIPSIAKLY
jgi:uncharacterized membrane protein